MTTRIFKLQKNNQNENTDDLLIELGFTAVIEVKDNLEVYVDSALQDFDKARELLVELSYNIISENDLEEKELDDSLS